MIKRTIDISDGPTFLNIENDQLILTRERERIGAIPCEDVGVLLIDHRATTYTHSALTRLLDRGAVIVFCGENHLPEDHAVRRRLMVMAGEVKSGDSTNCEGVAARFYWPALMGESFRRDPEGDWPNPLLNYGYMVFRAAVARAIVAAGLHPAFGLYHSNRNNPFVLADDLVEVFRARVDRAVVGYVNSGGKEINKGAKRSILELLAEPISIGGQAGPLMVGLHRISASLVRCLQGSDSALELPE